MDLIEFVPPELPDVASPCVNVCVLDEVTGWCVGCGRTIEEIAGWSSASAVARRAILTVVTKRRLA